MVQHIIALIFNLTGNRDQLEEGKSIEPGPVFTNILILRIRIFLEFFLENSKNKYFWYSLNFYS